MFEPSHSMLRPPVGLRGRNRDMKRPGTVLLEPRGVLFNEGKPETSDTTVLAGRKFDREIEFDFAVALHIMRQLDNP
jgi:hypothetical protein